MVTEALNRRVVRVPDVVGRQLEKARIVLEDASLTRVVVLYRESYEDRDTVLEQRPARGQMVYEGTEVTIWVARRGYLEHLPAIYRRSDAAGPKESQYFRSPTSAVASLREALARGYGEIGRVRKHRTLYMVGRTRVHLDEVEGLGAFLELEVVLADGEPAQAGIGEAQDLMARLGIAPSALVPGAYIDLARP